MLPFYLSANWDCRNASRSGENSSTLQELLGQESNQNEIPATFPMHMFVFMRFFCIPWIHHRSTILSHNFRVQRNGFRETSSFSPASLLYPPDHGTKIPSGLHVVAVRMGHVRYDEGTSPSCTRQGHGKHQRGTTHRTLAHRIADGMHTGLVQVQSAKDLNESQRYLSGHCMVNGAKLEFHPMLRSIISREQFSMTKALRGTAWNTSAAGLQVLRTRLGCSDLSHNWAK